MTDNTTLDAAIEAGKEAYFRFAKTNVHWNNHDLEIARARALIAKLLEGMDGCDTRVLPSIYPAAVVWGYNAALTEIRRRSGIEVQS